MKRILVPAIVAIMIMAAIPTETAADWVEPIPGSETDDEFWHVTYDFEAWWEENFEAYEPGNSNREPDISVYDDKLWVLWEGLLVPNSPLEPVAYKGKMYLRSYSDRDGTPEWGEIIDISANAYYSDHTNQKGRLIVFKDKLYVFWQSGDRNQKPQGHPENQFDILVRTYDGNDLEQFTPPEIISRHGRFGNGGFDQIPKPIVYKDKLYVIWFREDIELGISDLLYRAFDGGTWSDINVLSRFPNNDTKNQYPSVAVYEDQLFVIWQRTLKGSTETEVVHSYSSDGNTWSSVQPLSRKVDKTSIAVDMLSELASYDNPRTGKHELHAIWRTYNTENTHGGQYDYDLVTRVYDGDSWGPTKELSPKYDKWDDTYPAALEYNGLLYILWSSKDNSVTDGADYDILKVVYDGETYSEPVMISRTGDRDGILFDDNEWWNLGDDQWPRMTNYPNQWGDDRLFSVWWSFDHITGCCYDAPEGAAHPTIVVKLVEDADHDADGVADQKDDCDDDPDDHIDTDGDGYCDYNDWRPLNPDKWEEPEEIENKGPENDPLPFYIILAVLIIAAVALAAFKGDKKKPRPSRTPKPHDEEE